MIQITGLIGIQFFFLIFLIDFFSFQFHPWTLGSFGIRIQDFFFVCFL